MREERMQIGWAEADLTPQGPVMLTGQGHARLSKGIESALKVVGSIWVVAEGGRQVTEQTTERLCAI